MASISVLGSTQTERLIHLALISQGPLTIIQLLPIVDGSAEYLTRVLRKMLADGIIERTDSSRGYKLTTAFGAVRKESL